MIRNPILITLGLLTIKPILIYLYGRSCGLNPFDISTYGNWFLFASPYCQSFDWLSTICDQIVKAYVFSISASFISSLSKFLDIKIEL